MRPGHHLLIALSLGVAVSAAGEAKAQYVYYASPVVQAYGVVAPVVAAPPIMAAPVVYAPPSRMVDSRAPVTRLQTALTKLGFFQCPITGERDHATNVALANFLKVVPPEVRQHFGNQVAAMAEAATRHEFPLGGR